MVPLDALRFDAEQHQMRVDGTAKQHVAQLRRVMSEGGDVPPIRVAKVGAILYVVDGWHRYEAARALGWDEIEALVATMSKRDAQLEAILANTGHGKSLKPKDKQRAWEAFVAVGAHLLPNGRAKSARQISRDFNGVYSHSTIITRLEAMGLEPNPDDDPVAPYRGDQFGNAKAEELADDVREKLKLALEIYAEIKDPYERRRLIDAFREACATAERDKEAMAEELLDI